MDAVNPEWVEAGARAIPTSATRPVWLNEDGRKSMAEATIAAVEPLIRADEREQWDAYFVARWNAKEADLRAQIAADLWAKVDGLRDRGLGTVLRSDVLALIDAGVDATRQGTDRAEAQRAQEAQRLELRRGPRRRGPGQRALCCAS